MRNLRITAVCLLTACLAATGPVSGSASTDGMLQGVGAWDGTTAKAKLEGPYVDVSQQDVPYGRRSFFHAPWRSYMDTWDGSRFLESLGVVYNMRPEEAEATAALMGEAGIRSARIEIGWDNLDYDDDSRFKEANRSSVKTMLTALKRHRIRPIILLNLNSGMPNPNADVKVELTRAASRGAREIFVKDTSGIKPGYTGFKGLGPAMFPVITQVDPATGKCTLSAPLPRDISSGAQTLIKLKYQPISGPVFADGKPNPASKETLDGWMKYVKTVTETVMEDLGTEGAADAGFDLEVYNEYTFGYHYLDINYYYEPDLSFSQKVSYTMDGKTLEGPEILLPMTVEYVRNPANRLPGVNVISGFSNQRPRDSGSSMWPGQSGFSRHYYSGYDRIKSTITPLSGSDYTAASKLYNDAFGDLDSTRASTNPDHSVPGSYYIPPHTAAFPEVWLYPYQTEMMVRDLQPFPGPWVDHFRYSSPGKGQMAQLWMTETNFNRDGFAREWMAAAGVKNTNPQLVGLMHHIGAKALLRAFTFYGHKGVHTMNAFAIKSGDTGFSILPDSFYNELKNNGYILTDAARAKAGPQLAVLKNVADLMKSGRRIDSPRPLKVTELTEYNPRLVFAGDGTPEHPDRYHRDDFAVLPYQLSDLKFAIGYYVVTRNVANVWNPSLPVLDPSRYSMPDQTFELTLANVVGKGAKVSAYDPMTNQTEPVEILKADNTSLTVKVKSADYPRFLILEESPTGPLIENPVLTPAKDGALLTFQANTEGVAEITYGEYPVRSGGTFRETRYSDHKFANLAEEREVEALVFELSDKPGAWTWKGTIVPEYSERYTFTAHSDNLNNVKLKLDGQEVSLNGIKGSGSIDLKAGVSYELEMTYLNEWSNRHYVGLFWSSQSQDKAPVPAALPEGKKITVKTSRGSTHQIPLPGMEEGDGFRIKLTSSNGITTRYPFWDYDNKGVLYTKP